MVDLRTKRSDLDRPATMVDLGQLRQRVTELTKLVAEMQGMLANCYAAHGRGDGVQEDFERRLSRLEFRVQQEVK